VRSDEAHNAAPVTGRTHRVSKALAELELLASATLVARHHCGATTALLFGFVSAAKITLPRSKGAPLSRSLAL